MAGLGVGTGVRAGATTLGGRRQRRASWSRPPASTWRPRCSRCGSRRTCSARTSTSRRPAPREAVAARRARSRRRARGTCAERRAASLGLAAIGSHRFFYGLSTVATDPALPQLLPRSRRQRRGLHGLSVAVLVSRARVLLGRAVLTPVATARTGHAALDRRAARGWPVSPRWCRAASSPSRRCWSAAFVLGLCAQGIKICVDTLVQDPSTTPSGAGSSRSTT